ncbi:tRNA lysidine(34) synthetase TilS [Pilimelia columellifera subsp. columellifera]|uniref:tRNA(Ile)-lysidine synthase n=1 Tax=Pilimelia columellifera subsp. columellifera TaxID=706583 RepID=A0ABP6AMD3_9ACTN
MAALPPALAAVRVAVRRSLAGLPSGALILVACSGGADSLALAAAALFVAPRQGLRVGLVTVDHGLQDGSAQRAAGVLRWASEAGFAPAEVATVSVVGRPGGPEAAARFARYEGLTGAAARHGAAALLVGHTRDDQAETVLLALARGAGPRGLAGMPARRERDGVLLLRPLLDVPRDQARAACLAAGLVPWDDPHNVDATFARSRVRAEALPALVAALGPAVVANLARTARLLGADSAVLDELAVVAAGAAADGDDLRVGELRRLPEAVRTRVLHAWALRSGAVGGALAMRHVGAIDALVARWRGQGPVQLPGGVVVSRRAGRLTAWRPAGAPGSGGSSSDGAGEIDDDAPAALDLPGGLDVHGAALSDHDPGADSQSQLG